MPSAATANGLWRQAPMFGGTPGISRLAVVNTHKCPSADHKDMQGYAKPAVSHSPFLTQEYTS